MLHWKRHTAPKLEQTDNKPRTIGGPGVADKPRLRTGKFVLAALAWSFLVFLSLWAQRGQLDRTAESLARIDAIANLRKDMAIRKWASSLGGVFIDEAKAPNVEALSEQERLAATRSSTGEQLKLVNLTPIHILLAIQQVSNKEYGSTERLTSLQLRNRANIPDDWETKALKALEGGSEMVTESVPRKGSHGLMRVMIPMRMEKECLECHRDTLVPAGGLRGGAAMTVNLNAYRTAQEPTWQSIQYWHLGIWLLGLTGLYAFWIYSGRRAIELARQEEERRENETAFGAMAEGAVITDADGKIRWVNDAFCHIYGYRPEEVIGQTPRILKSGRHDEKFYQEFWRQLTTAGRWRGELWNRRKTGEVFPEEISVQALRAPDGRTVRYISIFSDITERKRNEEELQRYREHLEELVKSRTEELTEARDQAEAANRAKSLFLANMSHELRTPLNAVIGFSQLMDKDPLLSPIQRRNMEIINSSGNHLLTLINDVLELSKIESGKVRLAEEEVSVAEILRQVVSMMRGRAEETGLVLAMEIGELPPLVHLDAVKLRQVLLNLLSNAIKFTPSGRVVIGADAGPATDGRVAIDFVVSDTGIGIAPEDQQRIFEPFEQAGTRPPPGGTGLGLTISRQYVQMMGGELTLESTPGQGATFRFSIVAAIGAARDEAPSHRHAIGAGPEARGRRVLVVDDATEARLLIRALLEPYGIAVAEAEDGPGAERAIETFAPELVLMDWRLPGADGLAVIRRIRALPGIRQPHIVMLTANALDSGRDQALAAGADGFLSKPFQQAELYDLIEQNLGLKFEYEPAAKTQPRTWAPDEAAAELAGLSADRRANLVRAAISLNPEQIAAALADVAAERPELASRLRSLAESMDYHRLWQTLGIADPE